MYDRLRDIFNNVNDWLKFAEAKHGALVALNSGVIFGIISVFKQLPFIPFYVIFICVTFLGTSILLSFLSLFPRHEKKGIDKKKPTNANLFSSRDLSMYDAEDLKEELNKRSNTAHVFTGLEEDLIHQIILNAYISTRKYKLFKIAIYVTLSAFIAPLIFVIEHFFHLC